MKAFASDLDRTLIYSKKMVEAYGASIGNHLIETLNGRELSFISTNTKRNLMKINKEIYFIPVTTRTMEQYHRLTLFHDEIQPEYVITSNGGCILKDGNELKEWTHFVQDSIGKNSLNTMLKKVEKFSFYNSIKRVKIGDGFFFYLIMEQELIQTIDLQSLRKWANGLGWQTSVQGRKLYFIPESLNKWHAVDYLKNKIGLKTVYSAGDSLLDLALISNSDYGLSPAHGEVLKYYPMIESTTYYGIKSSEEITQDIINKMIS